MKYASSIAERGVWASGVVEIQVSLDASFGRADALVGMTRQFEQVLHLYASLIFPSQLYIPVIRCGSPERRTASF